MIIDFEDVTEKVLRKIRLSILKSQTLRFP